MTGKMFSVSSQRTLDEIENLKGNKIMKLDYVNEDKIYYRWVYKDITIEYFLVKESGIPQLKLIMTYKNLQTVKELEQKLKEQGFEKIPEFLNRLLN